MQIPTLDPDKQEAAVDDVMRQASGTADEGLVLSTLAWRMQDNVAAGGREKLFQSIRLQIRGKPGEALVLETLALNVGKLTPYPTVTRCIDELIVQMNESTVHRRLAEQFSRLLPVIDRRSTAEEWNAHPAAVDGSDERFKALLQGVRGAADEAEILETLLQSPPRTDTVRPWVEDIFVRSEDLPVVERNGLIQTISEF